MSGPRVRSCLLLLAALSSSVLTEGTAQGGAAKTTRPVDTTNTSIIPHNKDLTPKGSKNVRSQTPSKRHIRKFDFDAEFASYLGLASQADTARYLAGDAESSYKAPAAFHGNTDGNHYPPLRLIPGSTPASFAYFTQIYPAEHSDGDIRIEHFSPVIHPFSSEREKSRYRDDDDKPAHYDRTESNYYPKDEHFYAPPKTRSYFGRYSNKKKYSKLSEDDDYGPKSRKNPYQEYKGLDDDSTPDYKTGYRHVGMYHKFHEEDLYPKKTSSEWIPPKQSSKSRTKQTQEADGDNYDPDGFHDTDVTPEDFHVKSKHDDEITRIKTNIENEPPYSTNNFDITEEPYAGTLKSKEGANKGADNYSSDYFPTGPVDELPIKPAQRVRKHKRRRKKKKHHQHGRPGYRSSPVIDGSAGRPSDYKAPSFEFHNPVTSYVSPPYTPPETYENNLRVEPYKKQAESYDSPKEPHKPPLEPFQVEPENDLPETGEAHKDVSFDGPSEVPQEPADIDDGPLKLDDLDEDYHIISEAGPREHAEHTKDFDKRLPQDDKIYGSFETFDSQLDSASNKKFEPFVQYPFDDQRKKLTSVVEELIESGKIR